LALIALSPKNDKTFTVVFKDAKQLGPGAMRPLKNVQFCSSSRKAKILNAGIH